LGAAFMPAVSAAVTFGTQFTVTSKQIQAYDAASTPNGGAVVVYRDLNDNIFASCLSGSGSVTNQDVAVSTVAGSNFAPDVCVGTLPNGNWHAQWVDAGGSPITRGYDSNCSPLGAPFSV